MTAAQALQVRAARLAAAQSSQLGPSGAAWNLLRERDIPLEPTPLDRQPSAYVQTAWREKTYGTLAVAGLTAAVAGPSLFLRLRWLAPEPRPAITDNDIFADAAALLFPLNGVDAPLETMGDERHPVQAWHWRAGAGKPFVLNATGLGTATRFAHHPVEVADEWANGQWSVVFSGPLHESGVALTAAGSIPVGVAIWCGARGERAGLKSHTPAWITLALP
ncbi:MAG: hypothetical protein C0506_06510 [Anaerolinea sp.]|nr:hypothetical protein [Anaerolinea sp.]